MDKTSILTQIMKYKGFGTKASFASFLGIKPNTLSNWFSRNTFDIDVILEKIPELNKAWLLTGEGNMLNDAVSNNTQSNIPQGELKPKEYSTSIKVRLVSNKAKAGWSEGYYNEEYLEELPVVMIDADENDKGKYVAVEVEGDSMEPDYLERANCPQCRNRRYYLPFFESEIRGLRAKSSSGGTPLQCSRSKAKRKKQTLEQSKRFYVV